MELAILPPKESSNSSSALVKALPSFLFKSCTTAIISPSFLSSTNRPCL